MRYIKNVMHHSYIMKGGDLSRTWEKGLMMDYAWLCQRKLSIPSSDYPLRCVINLSRSLGLSRITGHVCIAMRFQVQD